MSYDNPDTAIVDSSEDIYIPFLKKSGSIFELCKISGTAKLAIKEDWKVISNVSYILLDSDNIEVMTIPDGYEDDRDYDYDG